MADILEIFLGSTPSPTMQSSPPRLTTYIFRRPGSPICNLRLLLASWVEGYRSNITRRTPVDSGTKIPSSTCRLDFWSINSLVVVWQPSFLFIFTLACGGHVFLNMFQTGWFHYHLGMLQKHFLNKDSASKKGIIFWNLIPLDFGCHFRFFFLGCRF